MSSKNNQEDLSPIEEIKKEYLEKIDYFGNRRSKYALYKKFSKKYNLNKRVFLTSSIRLMKMSEVQKDMNWEETGIKNNLFLYIPLWNKQIYIS